MAATSLMSLRGGVAQCLVGVAWPMNADLPLLPCVSQSVEVAMTTAAVGVKPLSMVAARTRSQRERKMDHVIVGPLHGHSNLP